MNSNRDRQGTNLPALPSALALCVALGLATSGCSEKANTAESKSEVSQPANHAAAKNSVKGQVSAETDKHLAVKRQALLAQAVDALAQTRSALKELNEGHKKAALDALASATGKLDLAVALAPQLALAPVNVTVTRQDLLGNVKDVKDLRHRIKDLIDDGKIQSARPLMRSFGSEIRIETANLPLATYPAAIKYAAKLIDQDKPDQARSVLETALSTLVMKDDVVPLPLLRARAMLNEAQSRIKGGKPQSQKHQIDVNSLIKNAAYQIKLAQAFGYGDSSLYKKLKDNLDQLEDKVEKKKESGGLFDSIGEQIRKLLPSDWR